MEAQIQLPQSDGADFYDVVIMGGGNVIAQAIDQGLVDEMALHVSPIVMGAGTPLWSGVAWRQLRQTDVRVSPYATHITYRVLP